MVMLDNGDDSNTWEPNLQWTCSSCNGLDLMDDETVMGESVSLWWRNSYDLPLRQTMMETATQII